MSGSAVNIFFIIIVMQALDVPTVKTHRVREVGNPLPRLRLVTTPVQPSLPASGGSVLHFV